MRSSVRTLLPALLCAGLPALAGCGPAGPPPPGPADTIGYGSFGTRAEIDCGAGKYLTVSGSNNRLTVTGTCASVTVAGADNTITVEQITDRLTITGLNNAVSYRAGQPEVDDSGAGNRITGG